MRLVASHMMCDVYLVRDNQDVPEIFSHLPLSTYKYSSTSYPTLLLQLFSSFFIPSSFVRSLPSSGCLHHGQVASVCKTSRGLDAELGKILLVG